MSIECNTSAEVLRRNSTASREPQAKDSLYHQRQMAPISFHVHAKTGTTKWRSKVSTIPQGELEPPRVKLLAVNLALCCNLHIWTMGHFGDNRGGGGGHSLCIRETIADFCCMSGSMHWNCCMNMDIA